MIFSPVLFAFYVSWAVTGLGVFLLSRMTVETSTLDFCLRMAVLGIGLGPGQSLFSMAIQNALPPTQMGVATSSSQFFRQIGSTIGVALFGTALTNRMSSGLEKVAPGVRLDQLQAMGGEHAADMGLALPPAVQEIVADSVTHGLTLAQLLAKNPQFSATCRSGSPSRIRFRARIMRFCSSI